MGKGKLKIKLLKLWKKLKISKKVVFKNFVKIQINLFHYQKYMFVHRYMKDCQIV